MWVWRAKAAAAAFLAAALTCGIAGAVNLCTLTGNLTLIDGAAGANAQVFFQTISTQSFGGTVIPASSFSVFTDSNGNLPPGVTVPQGAIVQVTVGSGQPVQIQIPLAATADLATLILANNDPPSVISALAIGAGGDFGLTVTNPGTGSIGTAVLQPGKVSSIQGFAFSPQAPGNAQIPIFSTGANRWQPESITGDAGLAPDGTLAINGIAAGGDITGKSTGGPFSISNYNVNNEFNPMQYGAKLDARRVGDVSVVNGSSSISSSSANFTAADVGKLVVIWNAANGAGSDRTFTGSITSVAAPSAVLSAPYSGASQSNATAFIGTDDGAAINTALQAVAPNNSGVVKVPGGLIMTTSTLTVAGRSEEFAGQGLGGNLTTGAGGGKGTVIVWAGGNQPVIQIVDSFGARVHDFAIMGSDQPGTMPSACVDLLNNSGGNLSGHSNSFNVVSNIECGDLSDLGLPGAGSGNPTVTTGIMADASGTQNDRNIIDNVTVKHAVYGIQWGQNQAIEWAVRDFRCDRDGICVDAHVGFTQVEFTQVEDLQSALSFFVGQNGYVTVRNFADETDGPTTIAPPWSASFTYPRNFVVKDSNGNFEIASVSGTSGASQPAWAPSSGSFAISLISRSTNTVTVTTTSPHDFTIGQSVGIVNVADQSFNGAFTITSVPASNQFTYNQTAANAASNGGSAYHATMDNGIAWLNTGTATAFSQLALFAGSGGSPGGTLALTDSVWDASNQLPYNLDFISGNGADFTFLGNDFRLVNSELVPPVGVPIVDLSASGIGSRTFKCDGCRGIAEGNFKTAVTGGDPRQITYIDMQRLAGPNGNAGNSGIGEYFINALVNGDPAGVDAFRYDFPGKLREIGGPLSVQALATPSLTPFQLSCSDGGSPANNTYLYRYTAISGTGETLASGEASVFCTGNIGVSGVTVNGAVAPVLGADSYNIYRTVANGGTGTEKLALSIPANTVGVTLLGPNSFTDGVADASLGRVLPAFNSTGNGSVAGVFSTGASAAIGSRAGDISAARGAGSGALWLGSNGSQSLDFGITSAGAFTLLGGGLSSPGLSITGGGALVMGSVTVAALGACNASNRFSWRVVTDNNAGCAYGGAPAGGGSVICPVFCNGTSWQIH